MSLWGEGPGPSQASSYTPKLPEMTPGLRLPRAGYEGHGERPSAPQGSARRPTALPRLPRREGVREAHRATNGVREAGQIHLQDESETFPPDSHRHTL